jgi:hypothetical protein
LRKPNETTDFVNHIKVKEGLDDTGYTKRLIATWDTDKLLNELVLFKDGGGDFRKCSLVEQNIVRSFWYRFISDD